MFGKNLGLHVIQFPSSKWGFVGDVPSALCEVIEARTSDIMGCRECWEGDDGKLYTYKTPTFDSEQETRDYAELKHCPLNN